MTAVKRLLLLVAPHHVVLPALDRGEHAVCRTLELARSRWLAIESDARHGRVEEALLAMEQLARDMYETTMIDPEPWKAALSLARRTLYENMRSLAVWKDDPAAADAVIRRCAIWDKEAQEMLQGKL